MCLDMRYDKKTEAAMIAKLPDEFVVYKVVRVRDGRFRGDCTGFRFRKGVNISPVTDKKGLNYKPHFHSFRAVSGARKWGVVRGMEKVIECRVRKKDITAIGSQDRHTVIVSKKIIMPSPSDRKAVV